MLPCRLAKRKPLYNPTSDFVISENGKSAPARLIFDSIDGTISGWNPDVDPTHAILIRDTFANGTPSVYTGLDMAQNSRGQTVLYAADFLNNRVEMIDGSFHTISTFTDPTATSIDPNFSVWSVQAQSGKLYVTWADLKNFSGGVVDVFDTDGNLLTPNHFAANAPGQGPLQNPWGITQAPANFGAYSNDILIGSVAGAGNINVYKPDGTYLGQLRQPNGAPIAIKGLWDLEFGDGSPHGGKANWLYFDAGPNKPGDSTGGLFGVIHAAGDQDHQHEHPSLVSASIVSSPTRSSPNGMLEQQMDAIFQELDAVSLSLDANLSAMHPQLSGFFAMLHSNLDALETTVLDRLDALEAASLSMM